MNIETTNAAFRRVALTAAKVVERRNTIPILSTLRCRANGKLEMSATDLNIQLSASVPIAGGPEQSFCMMSPREVVNAIAEAGGDDVSISVDDGKANFASGAMSIKVGTFHADDFPTDADRPFAAIFTATLSPTMLAGLARVAASISKEETRYYLNGINVKRIEGNQFRIAATDGHRLSYLDIMLPDADGELGDVIIPRKAVRLLIELGSNAGGDIKLSIGTIAASNTIDSTAPAPKHASRMEVKFDVAGMAVVMRSKLIDGTFPDYSRVIPTGNDKPMLFKSADLRRAIKGVSGHSKQVRAVKIVLDKTGASMSAKFLDLDLDTAATVPCEHRNNGFEIGINGAYLLDMIDAAGGDEIVVTAADASAPMTVRNPADTAWGGVLMPMRV